MLNDSYHTPVMSEETKRYLINKADGIYIDCTMGGGGHSFYLLQQFPGIKIIGLDVDESAIEESEKKLLPYKKRFRIFRQNFNGIADVLRSIGKEKIDGILADLGVSSRQFDDEAKGFSFNSSSLDMRMDKRQEISAASIVNTYDFESLKKIFEEYGEERFAEKIARGIIEERKRLRIGSGRQLAALVEKIKHREGRVHPATKIFQALRIYINKELDNLKILLEIAPEVLNKGGRVVIISYHSLEDRIVKNSFKDMASRGIMRLLTKKVVIPSSREVSENSRARSAKLRAAEKI